MVPFLSLFERNEPHSPHPSPVPFGYIDDFIPKAVSEPYPRQFPLVTHKSPFWQENESNDSSPGPTSASAKREPGDVKQDTCSQHWESERFLAQASRVSHSVITSLLDISRKWRDYQHALDARENVSSALHRKTPPFFLVVTPPCIL
jgi:hypothetical protein